MHERVSYSFDTEDHRYHRKKLMVVGYPWRRPSLGSKMKVLAACCKEQSASVLAQHISRPSFLNCKPIATITTSIRFSISSCAGRSWRSGECVMKKGGSRFLDTLSNPAGKLRCPSSLVEMKTHVCVFCAKKNLVRKLKRRSVFFWSLLNLLSG